MDYIDIYLYLKNNAGCWAGSISMVRSRPLHLSSLNNLGFIIG